MIPVILDAGLLNFLRQL